MTHKRHDPRFSSHAIYEQGLAIGSSDIRTGIWYFRYYDESYAVPAILGVKKRKFPEFRHEVWVAAIDTVRKAAHG